MANFSVPTGLLVRMGRKVAAEVRGAGGKAGAHDACDADLERRISLTHGPIGDVAASVDTVVALAPACNGVSLVDPIAGQEIHAITLDGAPLDVAVAADRAFVTVAGAAHDAVAVIDLESGAVTATFALGTGATALAVSPNGKRVYVGGAAEDQVALTVIDVTAERLGTIDIGSAPGANIDAVQVDPDGSRVYVGVTDDRGSQLVVVDAETARVRRVIRVGAPLRDLAYVGGALCVLTSDRTSGGVVHSVDLTTGRITERVVVGGAPTRIAVSPDEARAYVVDYDRVSVIDTFTLTVVETITVPARPSAVAQQGSLLYVADYAGSVSVFTAASAIEATYARFLTAPPIAFGAPRALQPVGV